ncbi:hypothetical protein FA13DRAFT_1780465 [Coprinellus micaceus]|uniref:Uncharacterized protein n=1 Tax=Coprinellus micaceus TaxID=71717 RepID=A0A4Y7SDE1_COPMI|nr:hypothetical protein FA13DRAFT_1780465 [Coprinellus micaceus]
MKQDTTFERLVPLARLPRHIPLTCSRSTVCSRERVDPLWFATRFQVSGTRSLCLCLVSFKEASYSRGMPSSLWRAETSGSPSSAWAWCLLAVAQSGRYSHLLSLYDCFVSNGCGAFSLYHSLGDADSGVLGLPASSASARLVLTSSALSYSVRMWTRWLFWLYSTWAMHAGDESLSVRFPSRSRSPGGPLGGKDMNPKRRGGDVVRPRPPISCRLASTLSSRFESLVSMTLRDFL